MAVQPTLFDLPSTRIRWPARRADPVAGPGQTRPALPGRRAFAPADDAGQVLVDLTTGEILGRPTSTTRAARLGARGPACRPGRRRAGREPGAGAARYRCRAGGDAQPHPTRSRAARQAVEMNGRGKRPSRRNACSRKRALTRREAQSAAAERVAGGAAAWAVEVYRCLHDRSHWHIGHRTHGTWSR